jgi:GR25 family glycosyltransferase involved in LPS biosynthesis
MDCIYINLDKAEERRLHVEKNFAAHKKPDWTLARFPAVDKISVERNNIGGAAKPGEKGCFLSHRNLLEQRLGDDKSYLVVEDDAMIGARTCSLIERVLESNRDLDWDILFTDVCIPSMPLMFELLKVRRDLCKRNIDVEPMNLRGVEFAGSTAYIVNGKSKRKMHEILSAYKNIDLPYDLYLRQLSHTGALKIYTLFPFVTTLSDLSDGSQIKAESVNPIELSWNMFRKMIWTERNLNHSGPALELFRNTWCRDEPLTKISGADDELNAFTFLFSSMAALPQAPG